jgi:hypothetical protein
MLRKACAALWLPACLSAGSQAHEAIGANGDATLENPLAYRIVLARPDWTLAIRANSLDIWRGNPPYEKLKTGHAVFALTWKEPVELPQRRDAVRARSALISYVFSCSPPVESVLAKVVFFSTPFIPRNESMVEQWHTMRDTVAHIEIEQAPAEISWGEVFDERGRRAWDGVWKEIYKFSCRGA